MGVSQSWSVVRMACGQLLLLLLLGVTSARGSEEAMTELKRNIFYHYDTNVIPQENGTDSDPLSVHLGVAPTWVDLDSNGVMTIIMWLKLSWRDHRLAWDPDNYDDVSVLRIAPNLLWKPDVALYNKQDLSKGILAADPKSSNTNAQLFSNGNILWTVPVSHKILCEGITYSNWPWGTQMCNLSFGSWSYDSSDFDLHFYDDMVKMDLRQFGKYNQFKILKQDAIKEVTRYDCCPLPLVKLKFHFTLKREFVVDPNLGRINNPDDNFP